MPQVYIHATQTLFAYGRAYFDQHQAKDAPHRWLGRNHRSENHDWYNAFGTHMPALSMISLTPDPGSDAQSGGGTAG